MSIVYRKIVYLAKLNCSKTHEGVPESFWKHHKSKDRDFLHRSYTAKIFPTPKRKNFGAKKNRRKKFRQKITEKMENFKKSEKWKISNLKKSQIWKKNQKSSFFNFLIFRGKKCVIFFRTFFSKKFFRFRKKIFFFGAGFFFGYSFDVKIHDLSIYEVFRAIPELLRGLIDRRVAGCRKKSVKILKITGSSYRVIGGPGAEKIFRGGLQASRSGR